MTFLQNISIIKYFKLKKKKKLIKNELKQPKSN